MGKQSRNSMNPILVPQKHKNKIDKSLVGLRKKRRPKLLKLKMKVRYY